MVMRDRSPCRVPFLGAALIGLATLAMLPGWSQAQAPKNDVKLLKQLLPPPHTPEVKRGTYGGRAAEVEAAQATFNLREKQYKRLKSLADAKAIEQDLVAEAEEKLALAQQALKAAQTGAQADAAAARVEGEEISAKVDECKKNLQASMARVTTAKAEVEEALAAAKYRQTELDRMQKLADGGLIDQRLVAEAKEQSAAAHSTLQAAEVSAEMAQADVELQEALLAEAVARLKIADIRSRRPPVAPPAAR